MDITLVEFDDRRAKRDGYCGKVVKSDAEWKKQLTPAQYAVAVNAGTEPALHREYHYLHDQGIYRCVCSAGMRCSARNEIRIRHGWPSYWEPIAAENIETATDTAYGMKRTEVRCRKGDAHLGHVFEDGRRRTPPALLHEFGRSEFPEKRLMAGLNGIRRYDKGETGWRKVA